MSVKISEDNFEAEVLQSAVPVLVDFYSDSCIPCKRMSPVLAELEEESGGAWKLCKVNVGANMPLARRHSILSAPTLVFFKNGGERERHHGFLGKEPVQDILSRILEG